MKLRTKTGAPKLLAICLSSLVLMIALRLSFLEEALPYSEIWITEMPTLETPDKVKEEDKPGQSLELLNALGKVKTKGELKNWQADRRYKSSFVYLKANDINTLNNLHNNVKEYFHSPIVRALPQTKTKRIEKTATYSIILLIFWFIIIWIILSNKSTIYISLILLICTLCLGSYIWNSRPWINQIEFQITSTKKPSKLTYGDIQSLTIIKGKIGELTTRILEGENKSATFKLKSAHRIYNQKGHKNEAFKMWVRSDCPKEEIEAATLKAQDLLLAINEIFKTQEKLHKEKNPNQ
jgi:hypothetical protein